jgi:hypothetical protein
MGAGVASFTPYSPLGKPRPDTGADEFKLTRSGGCDVIDELVPAARQVLEQYSNSSVEADHGQLKARLRPMRGLKTTRSLRAAATGHAFVQNLRRGQYEIRRFARLFLLAGLFSYQIRAVQPSQGGNRSRVVIAACVPLTGPPIATTVGRVVEPSRIGLASGR